MNEYPKYESELAKDVAKVLTEKTLEGKVTWKAQSGIASYYFIAFIDDHEYKLLIGEDDRSLFVNDEWVTKDAYWLRELHRAIDIPAAARMKRDTALYETIKKLTHETSPA